MQTTYVHVVLAVPVAENYEEVQASSQPLPPRRLRRGCPDKHHHPHMDVPI